MKHLNDVNYKDCVGKVCKSKSSGDFKIVKYNDNRNVEIQFLNTGYKMVTRLDCIADGRIKDRYLPSVHGVGILGTKYLSKVNGVETKEYMLWKDMLKRCYSDSFKRKTQPMNTVNVQKTLSITNIFMNGVINKLDLGTRVGIWIKTYL